MNNCIFTHSLVVKLFLLSEEKGNKTGKACNSCDEVSKTNLRQCRASIDNHDFRNLQKHVVLMYNKIRAVTSVNQGRLGDITQ